MVDFKRCANDGRVGKCCMRMLELLRDGIWAILGLSVETGCRACVGGLRCLLQPSNGNRQVDRVVVHSITLF